MQMEDGSGSTSGKSLESFPSRHPVTGLSTDDIQDVPARMGKAI